MIFFVHSNMASVPTHSNQGSLLEKLPTEILTKVMGFVELSSQWQLASCNKLLLRILTQDCAELWTHIRFANSTFDSAEEATVYYPSQILRWRLFLRGQCEGTYADARPYGLQQNHWRGTCFAAPFKCVGVCPF